MLAHEGDCEYGSYLQHIKTPWASRRSSLTDPSLELLLMTHTTRAQPLVQVLAGERGARGGGGGGRRLLSSLFSVYHLLFSLCNILAASIISPTACDSPLSVMLRRLVGQVHFPSAFSLLLLFAAQCLRLTFYSLWLVFTLIPVSMIYYVSTSLSVHFHNREGFF